MAWVETRITRTTQPQDGCGIDWSNRYGNLHAFVIPHLGELVKGVPLKNGSGVGRGVGPGGVVSTHTGISSSIDFGASGGFGTLVGADSQWTITMQVELADFASTYYLLADSDSSGSNYAIYAVCSGGVMYSRLVGAQGAIMNLPSVPLPSSYFTLTLVRGALDYMQMFVNGVGTTRGFVTQTLKPGVALRLGANGLATATPLQGRIAYLAIHKFAFTEADTKAFNANPYQAFLPDSKALWTPAAASVSLPTLVQPNATTSAGAWTATGAATLHDAINEPVASDTQYISVNSASTTELVLAESAHPGAANQTLAYRASSTQGSTLTVTLKQGVTTIMTRTHALTGIDTLYTQTLTAPEIALITAGPISVTLTTS